MICHNSFSKKHCSSVHKELFTTPIPTKWVGPICIASSTSSTLPYTVDVPLATYENPLWPSVERGAKLTTRAGGIHTTIIRDAMTRSVALDAFSSKLAYDIAHRIQTDSTSYKQTCEATSRFLKVKNIHTHIVSSLVFIRVEAHTGDASGHNMITKAADALLKRVCDEFPAAKYISVSGNFCTDKKVSSVNAILGRGKSVIAETTISEKLCLAYLRAKPQQIVELNIKKNLIGSIISGAVESANAHYANMLLAIYLATGQDAANIVEGSQGITFCEERQGALYFSITLPNLIVGTIGSGKESCEVQTVLEKMQCMPRPQAEPGLSSQRLSEIIAAAVLCGELSLLGAQINPGELIATHLLLERK